MAATTFGVAASAPYAGVSSVAPPCGGHSLMPVSGICVVPYDTVPENGNVADADAAAALTSIAARFDGVRNSAPSRTTTLSGWLVFPMSK